MLRCPFPSPFVLGPFMRLLGIVLMSSSLAATTACATLDDMMPFGGSTGATPETATSTTPGLAIDRKTGYPPYAHYRSGVGLVSYAQKDPKTEYRRQGMKAYGEMWQRIGMQVTSAIFRLERESADFDGSQWQVTSVSHEEFREEPADAPSDPRQQMGSRDHAGITNTSESAQPVKPIRNFGPQVGRNDPCPCGSGKKYKKCCGANES